MSRAVSEQAAAATQVSTDVENIRRQAEQAERASGGSGARDEGTVGGKPEHREAN